MSRKLVFLILLLIVSWSCDSSNETKLMTQKKVELKHQSQVKEVTDTFFFHIDSALNSSNHDMVYGLHLREYGFKEFPKDNSP